MMYRGKNIMLPAIILAGGKGKRMGMLCRKNPKPVLPFAGIYRIIDFTLTNCIHSGIDNISVMVDYHHPVLTKYLQKWHTANGSPCSLHIIPPSSGKYNGTADAVYQNLEYIKGLDSDDLLVLSADHIYSMDYTRMVEFHRDSHAGATLAATPVPVKEAYRFGTLRTDRHYRILEFKEKSPQPGGDLASMGVYIFNKDLLIDWLVSDARRQDSSHDFGYSLLTAMVEYGNIYAYRFNGYWEDIGTMNSYHAAHMELLKSNPGFILGSESSVLTANGNPASCKIQNQDNIINSLISPGCVIEGLVINSVLCPGVIVEEHAEVHNSVLMAKSSIGYHSIINHCILAENVKVGKYSFLGMQADSTDSGNNITVLGQNVVTPDYVAIGSRCKVLPGTVAADFDSKYIRPDTVIAARDR